MKRLLSAVLHSFTFRPMLKEWALHLEAGHDPGVFAMLFLEALRDPSRRKLRQMCSVVAAGMAGRSWRQVHRLMPKRLDRKSRTAFMASGANRFYLCFRALVAHQIREYWRAYRKRKA